MATKYRPTWEELRKYRALIIVNGHECISLQKINRLVECVRKKGIHVEIPEDLREKRYWTESDYTRLRIAELIFESRTYDPDELDGEVVQVISANDKSC